MSITNTSQQGRPLLLCFSMHLPNPVRSGKPGCAPIATLYFLASLTAVPESKRTHITSSEKSAYRLLRKKTHYLGLTLVQRHRIGSVETASHVRHIDMLHNLLVGPQLPTPERFTHVRVDLQRERAHRFLSVISTANERSNGFQRSLTSIFCGSDFADMLPVFAFAGSKCWKGEGVKMFLHPSQEMSTLDEQRCLGGGLCAFCALGRRDILFLCESPLQPPCSWF